MNPAIGLARKTLPAEHFSLLLRQEAEQLSDLRKLKTLLSENRHRLEHLRVQPSTEQEMIDDWNQACALVSLAILEGDDCQLSQLESPSYVVLEDVWFRAVKELKAYYIWEHNDTGSPEGNYFKGTDEMRNRMMTGSHPNTVLFDRAQAYLEENYLVTGNNRKLADDKERARRMLEEKAYRIWETTGDTDPETNWSRARQYAQKFYENIIPAVTKPDRSCTEAVLDAFLYSKAPENRYLIINCFEAAVAIEFLDRGLVNDIFKGNPAKYASVI